MLRTQLESEIAGQSRSAPEAADPVDAAGQVASVELLSSPGHLLRVFQQVHTRLWAEHMTTDLTAPQFSALAALAQEPGVDQRTVGERASLDKATMAEMVVRLVQRGLLLRRRDPADGRRKLLSLSPLGAEVLQRTTDALDAVHDAVLAPLAPEERRVLVAAITAFAGLAENGAERAESARTLGYLIRVAQQGHTRLWSEFVPGDLTSPQYAVLHALARESGLDQRTLGERASLDKATMAELIGRLVRRGVVLRRRDPADGRRNLLALSTDGLALLESVAEGVDAVQSRMLDAIGGDPAARDRALLMLRRAARLED